MDKRSDSTGTINGPERASGDAAGEADSPVPLDVVTALRHGHREDLDRLLPLVYRELRRIAHRHLAARGVAWRGATLATTALVHESYLKLVDQSRAGWKDRAHFLALASLAMRHVLVDHARTRAALRRGGSNGEAPHYVSLPDDLIASETQSDALLALDDALTELAHVAPRLAQVVDCRFFGGLSEEEIATALGVTPRTVERDWVKARVLLRRLLERECAS